MSNISANNGGSLICVQFVRNQFKCEQCFAPSSLSSGIFASNAGINCNEFVVPGRERTICTRNASAIRSRVRDICFGSAMPGRAAANKTRAENKPISVSLRLYPFRPLEKFKNAVTKSCCNREPQKRGKQFRNRNIICERKEKPINLWVSLFVGLHRTTVLIVPLTNNCHRQMLTSNRLPIWRRGSAIPRKSLI